MSFRNKIFRNLFPSWKFFDEASLHIECKCSNGSQWSDLLPLYDLKKRNLFFNPERNLAHYFFTQVEQFYLHHSQQLATEDLHKEIETLVKYYLLKSASGLSTKKIDAKYQIQIFDPYTRELLFQHEGSLT